MKIKHIFIGFLAMAFVWPIVLPAPHNAWAQNQGKWYGNQGNTVWTLASGGTITADSGSAVTLAGTVTISGATTITDTVSLSKLLTLTGGITSSGPLFQHSGVARFTGGLATSTGADTLGGSALRITAPGTITALQTYSGGITSSGPLFQHSGVARFTGGFKTTGADTLGSSVLNVTAPMTYTYSGILTVLQDSTTAHVGIGGLDATNWVCLATVNTDTAVTVLAVPATNLLKVKLSGAVLAGSSGVKVSYVLFKKPS